MSKVSKLINKIDIENEWNQKICSLLDSDDDDLVDICFVAKDILGNEKKIKCHKFILAQASPIFKQQFYGPIKEEKEEIKIEDSNYEAFKDLIDFIYKQEEITAFSSIETAEVLEELFGLIYLAEKYQVEQLKSYLKSVLNHCIVFNDLNVFQYLNEIQKYRCFYGEYAILQERCFQYLDTKCSLFFSQENQASTPTPKVINDKLYDFAMLAL